MNRIKFLGLNKDQEDKLNDFIKEQNKNNESTRKTAVYNFMQENKDLYKGCIVTESGLFQFPDVIIQKIIGFD